MPCSLIPYSHPTPSRSAKLNMILCQGWSAKPASDGAVAANKSSLLSRLISCATTRFRYSLFFSSPLLVSNHLTLKGAFLVSSHHSRTSTFECTPHWYDPSRSSSLAASTNLSSGFLLVTSHQYCRNLLFVNDYTITTLYCLILWHCKT